MKSTPNTTHLSQSSHSSKHGSIVLLALGALGIVFGDIGTSPLYALNELFFGHALSHFTRIDVLGALSLVFWAVTIVITFKYVIFVMQADNEGEGGVYALYGKLASIKTPPAILLGLLIFGSGLLYGDGIITPAISVISSVEGLRVITHAFDPFIVPITIAILTLLFLIQSRGTSKIGAFFGPIMVIWFTTIALLGIQAIRLYPQIFQALNPSLAINFFTTHSLHTILLTLGGVMLTITGGEAMFADMGHFGKKPIRLGWIALAYPALILNYLGQGAYILSGSPIINNNIFYSMVTPWALPYVVILATLATVIASQAMISGAFSLTKQAISLRLLPYLPIKYTHAKHEGQIYIPHINWLLYTGSVLLVLVFQSGAKLAGAYGLAVSGDMLITTLSILVIATSIWSWNKIATILAFTPLILLDTSFVVANALKLFEGGYIPLTIGVVVFIIIKTWQWGRYHTVKTFDETPVMTIQDLIDIQQTSPNDLPRTMVFLSRKQIKSPQDKVPIQLQRYYDRNAILPEHIVLLNVILTKQPHAKPRTMVEYFPNQDSKNGTVTVLTVQFGFMENPEIEPLVKEFIRNKNIPSQHAPENWIFKIIHERLSLPEHASAFTYLRFKLYQILHRNSDTADHYFKLGQDHQLVIDVLPVKLT